MLAALMEAAFRSFLLAMLVWAGLRILRVRDVASQRCAWTAVLIGSLLMPFALPLSARWHILPLTKIPALASLDRLQLTFMPAASKTKLTAASPSDPAIVPMRLDQRATPQTAIVAASRNLVPLQSTHPVQPPAPGAAPVSAWPANMNSPMLRAALLIYYVVSAALLLRLLFGLVFALGLWQSSTPVPPGNAAQISANFKLRFSDHISTPITIGSGVVLPAGYTNWTEEKLRMVLAHERSHVDLHDFHVQILASLYAALAWFSPLGWWLKYKLSDLGEAISDRSGLIAAPDRSAYAEVLLEFAAAPRPTLIGVAMARPSSISRRIERLLNDSYLRHAFCGGARPRVAVLVVPIALFAAAALVQVKAAARSNPVVPAPNAAIATSPAIPAVPAFPAIQDASRASAATAVSAAPLSLAPPEIALLLPPSPPHPAAALENGATQSEAAFDRNLSFNGKLDLSVGTASGNITITRGPANQIHIHGIVKANKNGDPAQVQQIAANPPIQQEGNAIRIGTHGENLHDISISYQIEAPADASLSAATASGNIDDTGVGDGPKLNTASGNITATGLEGGFKAETGSGDITIVSAGTGDSKAQTGSGNIDVKDVKGALKAQTGSGTIRAAGTPSSPWKLQAGSGDIELSTGSAPVDLDASTGSGSISTISSTAMQTTKDHHHLQTQLNGGGPQVRAETGSGDIRIE